MTSDGEAKCTSCGKPEHLESETCIVLNVPEESADAAMTAAHRVFGDRLYIMRSDDSTTTFTLRGEKPSKLQIVVPKRLLP